MDALPRGISRVLQLVLRSIQWTSTAIVFGISSFFVSKHPRLQHVVFQEIIVCLVRKFNDYGTINNLQAVVSLVLFIPAFVAPFISTFFRPYAATIDMLFSYLYLYPP
jgi:hypothetical protein